VVFLGRILRHKGIHVLIAGLPEGVPLHIAGSSLDGDYLAELRALAAGKQVRFHLGPSDAEVLELLQRAMALVHPTPVDEHGSAGVHELFGLALVEAMACGCPVVASAVASLPEIVQDVTNGLLVPANEPASIAAALDHLRRDADAWRALALGARRRVEERYTWQSVALRCLAAYRNGVAESAFCC
jgi:glycosyltransferase involved in cell wall biosynthesis